MHEDILSLDGHLLDRLRAAPPQHTLSHIRWIDNLAAMLGQLLIRDNWYNISAITHCHLIATAFDFQVDILEM